MLTPNDLELRTRVLMLTPTARDAEVTCRLLTKAGLKCRTCENLRELVHEVRAGAGAALITDKALLAPEIGQLLEAIQLQPSWAELPVVILMHGGVQSLAATGIIRLLQNVTVVERPAAMRSVLSAVEAAVRGRLRQYQIQDQIEEIRRGEEALRESEERLLLAVNTARLGLWSLDLRTETLTCSQGCKANYGRGPDDPFTYKDLWDSIHPEDLRRVREAVRQSMAAHTDYDTEYRNVWPDGTTHWLIVRGKTVYGLNEEPLSMVGVTLDITERRQAEQDREILLESERAARSQAEQANRMKDEFLATLSHELRTPLNAILGWAQVLTHGKPSDEDLTEGLTTIERNARAQTQLIEDLLDMSRIVSGKLRLDVQPIDPTIFIEAAIETVRPAADARGIRIQKILDPEAGSVSGDPGRLQQVIWNLLSNAIKFTPKGGRVQVVLQRAASQIEIAVSDSGQGIKADFLPHVFDRFRQADATTTRKHGGLGLGLAIVKQLLELHGGTIQAQSEGENRGSTFIVSLPIIAAQARQRFENPVQAASTPSHNEKEFDALSLDGVRVLTVDDESDARNLIKRILEDCGAEVRTAGSGLEALELLGEFHPDVVISDIGMPDLDGYEFIGRVRKLSNSTRIPAIALTAFARSEDRTRALRAGFLAHVSKPVEPAELVATVASVAGRTLNAEKTN